MSAANRLLTRLKLDEAEVREFRYAGSAELPLARIKTTDGRLIVHAFESDWRDADVPGVQNRCRICPDTVGLTADLVAAEFQSDGQSDGVNCVMARTMKGLALLKSAENSGAVTLGGDTTLDELNYRQRYHYHQRRSAWARLLALRNGGRLVPAVRGLSLQDLARDNGLGANLREARLTLRRALDGHTSEPSVHPIDKL